MLRDLFNDCKTKIDILRPRYIELYRRSEKELIKRNTKKGELTKVKGELTECHHWTTNKEVLIVGLRGQLRERYVRINQQNRVIDQLRGELSGRQRSPPGYGGKRNSRRKKRKKKEKKI